MPCLRMLPLVALVCLAGCGRALGPERMETTTVKGRVHLRQKPIGVGWVEFVPVDGTIGRLRSAKLSADGSFEATRVPVGHVAIKLAGPPLPPTNDPAIDNFLFMIRRYPLIHKSVAPGGPAIDVELRDEAIAFERTFGQKR